jgi:hypothetical protein
MKKRPGDDRGAAQADKADRIHNTEYLRSPVSNIKRYFPPHLRSAVVRSRTGRRITLPSLGKGGDGNE